MTHPDAQPLGSPLDAATRALVRAAAVITGGSEADVRSALAAAHPVTPAAWIEELLLQTYLFAGFPRALNATREWRKLEPLPGAYASGAPDEAHHTHASTWEVRGEATCAVVYGEAYDRLRTNIAALHPVLDHWMIVDGYGKILSRPGLDLARRELCIVAACAATGQDRQLLSHLHGALHAGATPAVVSEALAAIADLLPDSAADSVPLLWQRVQRRSVTPTVPQPLS
jgi:4-carboxymuconolactone decarboxylase